MIKRLSILFVVMILVACKKDKLKDGKYLLLVGKWNWTHSPMIINYASKMGTSASWCEFVTRIK